MTKIKFGFLCLLLMASTTRASAQSLSETELNRLDYRFQSVIAEELPQYGLQSMALTPEPVLQEVIPGETLTNRYGAAIYTENPKALRDAGININSVFDTFVTSQVTAEDLVALAKLESVRFVDAGEMLYPMNDVAVAVTGAALLQDGQVNSTNYKGSGVIVCVIDSGIDWDHGDFLSGGNSRILYIWDQTLTAVAPEQTPDEAHSGDSAYDGFTYGVEYTQAHINDDLGTKTDGITVQETDTNGHGTHVTGTAAGNGGSLTPADYAGMAPEADIVVVKPGDGTFSFNRVIDGMNYCGEIAEDASKPVVVNMSLGTDQGPHDGTRSQDTAINSFVGAGKVVVVSAGNSADDDIHKSASVAASATGSFTVSVPTYGNSGDDDFKVEAWFDASGTVTATVTSPNSLTATQGSGSSTTTTADGHIAITNIIDEANGDRYVRVTVSDASGVDPATGNWTIELENTSGSSMTYHAWLYDRTLGTGDGAGKTFAAGYASITGADSDYTVGSPGSATGAITVGAFQHRPRWCDSSGSCYNSGSVSSTDDITDFSSRGPRRDAGAPQKPDIAGPGLKMGSSWSTDMSPAPDAASKLPGDKHRLTQGTSMSSPVVAGGIALLLQQTSTLTAAQIRTLIRDNADFDGFTGSVPNNTWGYGKFNVYQAMVDHIGGAGGGHEFLVYDQWAATSQMATSANTEYAVRFTPIISGSLTGLFIHPGTTVNITSNVSLEVWSDNGSGLPSTKLGSTVSIASSSLLTNSWNYVDMGGAGVSVVGGTDYHAVLYYTDGTDFYIRVEFGGEASIDNRSSRDSGGWVKYSDRDLRFRAEVTNNSAVTVAGTASTGNDTGWRMMAPPGSGLDRDDVYGVTFSSTSGSGNDILRRYDESNGTGNDRWLNTGAGVSLPHGLGFILYFFDDGTDPVDPNRTVSFSGVTETTTDVTTPSLDTNEDFQLVGNPFHTSFDLTELNLGDQGYQTTVQVWDPTAGGGTGSYTTVTQAGDASDLIAAGQGLFAQRTSTSPGSTTLTFDSDGRTTGAEFVGKTGNEGQTRISFILEGVAEDGSFVRDEAAKLLFPKHGLIGWDVYEASRLTPLASQYVTASFIGKRNNKPVTLAVASYPRSLQQTVAVPVQIDGRGFTGELTLSWPEWTKIPKSWNLSLVDHATGSTIDMRESSAYRFDFTSSVNKAVSAEEILEQSMTVSPQSEARFELLIAPGTSTSVAQNEQPLTYMLDPNYPNPFNPSTLIRYTLAETVHATLTVFDAQGRRVAVLIDSVQPAGRHETTWNGRDATGRLMPSGLYFYRLFTPAYSQTRSMLLVK